MPMLTFGVLYCFFVIGHDRRRILHCNVTRQPNALWIVLQLREAWGYDQPQRFLVFDRDAKFSADVVWTVQQNGTEPVRTAFRSPWQNGVAERWVGSVRRELLDHVIVVNERHMRRLLRDYIRYYHEDRTHLGLGKDTPCGRAATSTVAAATRWTAPPLRGRCLSLSPRRITLTAQLAEEFRQHLVSHSFSFSKLLFTPQEDPGLRLELTAATLPKMMTINGLKLM